MRAVGIGMVLTLVLVAPSSALAQPPAPRPLFPPQDLGLLSAPDRDLWAKPDVVMDSLGIADGAVVADLGAGGGWFTIRLARRVGPTGIVYAQDVQSRMLDAVARRVREERLTNVRTILGDPDDPALPGGIEVVLIVDAWREMDDPKEPGRLQRLLQRLLASLAPGGRIGVLDFLPGDGGPGPAARDRVAPEAVIASAQRAGLTLQKREVIPPFQFLLTFGVAPR